MHIKVFLDVTPLSLVLCDVTAQKALSLKVRLRSTYSKNSACLCLEVTLKRVCARTAFWTDKFCHVNSLRMFHC